MRKGQRVRVKTEELILELLQAHKWQRSDYVAGDIDEVVGDRIGVMIDGEVLWFNSNKLEKDDLQPHLEPLALSAIRNPPVNL